MFVFIIKILLGVLLIVWFSMMFVEIFKNSKKSEPRNKIAYIKEHRDVFGVNDVSPTNDNEDIIVLSPQQMYNENVGGTY